MKRYSFFVRKSLPFVGVLDPDFDEMLAGAPLDLSFREEPYRGPYPSCRRGPGSPVGHVPKPPEGPSMWRQETRRGANQ
jgi:hypothetical protein